MSESAPVVHAFRMKLKPGYIAEYKQRHDDIWPELTRILKDAGISDYRIFLDESDLSLFAILHVDTLESLAGLPSHPIMQKWWESMAPLMETEPSNKPVETALLPVFYMP